MNPASYHTAATGSDTMIWVISGFLCLGLIVAIIGVIFPEVVLEPFQKLWDKQFYYWK